MTRVAIVVPTRDRSASLRATLRSLKGVVVPEQWDVELVVVDNGSSDDTIAVAHEGCVGERPGTVVREVTQGVSRARNRGAAETTATTLLFLDDDMRPPTNWLVELAAPIIDGRAEATVSLFRAGPARPAWLSPSDFSMFVTEESVDPAKPFLVGGSMAISREAFERCGGFHEALGPGALGTGGEDLLLTHRLAASGGRLVCVRSVVVEHWFDPGKLTREAVQRRREDGRRSEAWLAYHWFGRNPLPSRIKAPILRLLRRNEQFSWHDQMCIESRRTREFRR